MSVSVQGGVVKRWRADGKPPGVRISQLSCLDALSSLPRRGNPLEWKYSMKFWPHLHNTQPEQMLELAHLAEMLGFEDVLGDDHWFLPARSPDKDPNERGPLPDDSIFPDLCVSGAATLAQINHGRRDAGRGRFGHHPRSLWSD